MILDPPADPVAMTNSPVSAFSTMELQMEDWGRLPPWMKLIGEAAYLSVSKSTNLADTSSQSGRNSPKPKALTCPGEEKSSISLFKIMPSSVTIPPSALPRRPSCHWRYGHVLTDLRAPNQVNSRGQTDSHTRSVRSRQMTGSSFSRREVVGRVVVGYRKGLTRDDLGASSGRDGVGEVRVLQEGHVLGEGGVAECRSLAVGEFVGFEH